MRPEYYVGHGEFEPFRLFEKWRLNDFYVCTALKYLSRKKKNQVNDDLKKAIEYLNRAQRLSFKQVINDDFEPIAEAWQCDHIALRFIMIGKYKEAAIRLGELNDQHS